MACIYQSLHKFELTETTFEQKRSTKCNDFDRAAFFVAERNLSSKGRAAWNTMCNSIVEDIGIANPCLFIHFVSEFNSWLEKTGPSTGSSWENEECNDILTKCLFLICSQPKLRLTFDACVFSINRNISDLKDIDPDPASLDGIEESHIKMSLWSRLIKYQETDESNPSSKKKKKKVSVNPDTKTRAKRAPPKIKRVLNVKKISLLYVWILNLCCKEWDSLYDKFQNQTNNQHDKKSTKDGKKEVEEESKDPKESKIEEEEESGETEDGIEKENVKEKNSKSNELNSEMDPEISPDFNTAIEFEVILLSLANAIHDIEVNEKAKVNYNEKPELILETISKLDNDWKKKFSKINKDGRTLWSSPIVWGMQPLFDIALSEWKTKDDEPSKLLVYFLLSTLEVVKEIGNPQMLFCNAILCTVRRKWIRWDSTIPEFTPSQLKKIEKAKDLYKDYWSKGESMEKLWKRRKFSIDPDNLDWSTFRGKGKDTQKNLFENFPEAENWTSEELSKSHGRIPKSKTIFTHEYPISPVYNLIKNCYQEEAKQILSKSKDPDFKIRKELYPISKQSYLNWQKDLGLTITNPAYIKWLKEKELDNPDSKQQELDSDNNSNQKDEQDKVDDMSEDDSENTRKNSKKKKETLTIKNKKKEMTIEKEKVLKKPRKSIGHVKNTVSEEDDQDGKVNDGNGNGNEKSKIAMDKSKKSSLPKKDTPLEIDAKQKSIKTKTQKKDSKSTLNNNNSSSNQLPNEPVSIHSKKNLPIKKELKSKLLDKKKKEIESDEEKNSNDDNDNKDKDDDGNDSNDDDGNDDGEENANNRNDKDNHKLSKSNGKLAKKTLDKKRHDESSSSSDGDNASDIDNDNKKNRNREKDSEEEAEKEEESDNDDDAKKQKVEEKVKKANVNAAKKKPLSNDKKQKMHTSDSDEQEENVKSKKEKTKNAPATTGKKSLAKKPEILIKKQETLVKKQETLIKKQDSIKKPELSIEKSEKKSNNVAIDTSTFQSNGNHSKDWIMVLISPKNSGDVPITIYIQNESDKEKILHLVKDEITECEKLNFKRKRIDDSLKQSPKLKPEEIISNQNTITKNDSLDNTISNNNNATGELSSITQNKSNVLNNSTKNLEQIEPTKKKTSQTKEKVARVVENNKDVQDQSMIIDNTKTEKQPKENDDDGEEESQPVKILKTEAKTKSQSKTKTKKPKQNNTFDKSKQLATNVVLPIEKKISVIEPSQQAEMMLLEQNTKKLLEPMVVASPSSAVQQTLDIKRELRKPQNVTASIPPVQPIIIDSNSNGNNNDNNSDSMVVATTAIISDPKKNLNETATTTTTNTIDNNPVGSSNSNPIETATSLSNSQETIVTRQNSTGSNIIKSNNVSLNESKEKLSTSGNQENISPATTSIATLTLPIIATNQNSVTKPTHASIVGKKCSNEEWQKINNELCPKYAEKLKLFGGEWLSESDMRKLESPKGSLLGSVPQNNKNAAKLVFIMKNITLKGMYYIESRRDDNMVKLIIWRQYAMVGVCGDPLLLKKKLVAISVLPGEDDDPEMNAERNPGFFFKMNTIAQNNSEWQWESKTICKPREEPQDVYVVKRKSMGVDTLEESFLQQNWKDGGFDQVLYHFVLRFIFGIGPADFDTILICNGKAYAIDIEKSRNVNNTMGKIKDIIGCLIGKTKGIQKKHQTKFSELYQQCLPKLKERVKALVSIIEKDYVKLEEQAKLYEMSDYPSKTDVSSRLELVISLLDKPLILNSKEDYPKKKDTFTKKSKKDSTKNSKQETDSSSDQKSLTNPKNQNENEKTTSEKKTLDHEMSEANDPLKKETENTKEEEDEDDDDAEGDENTDETTAPSSTSNNIVVKTNQQTENDNDNEEEEEEEEEGEEAEDDPMQNY